MPCMKCSNGKYKYGVNGNCVFDTLAACREAAAAIHAQEQVKPTYRSEEPCLWKTCTALLTKNK